MDLLSYFRSCIGLTTDSRKISSGCMFVALRGENFDGNSFAEDALKKGARYAVVDDPDLKGKDERLLWVEDALPALQQLARDFRDTWKIPVIGLTGSNGKTTTKELIHSVLSRQYKVYSTPGNFNNHIGVPLTILNKPEDTEIAIIEMGANHQKEIEFLCGISKPTHGLITNYGEAHLEGFGGIEGVIKGKSELYDFLRESGGAVIIHGDDPIQKEKSAGIRSISTFYTRKNKIPRITAEDHHGFLEVHWNDQSANTHLVGQYNLVNAAYAIVLGTIFGMTDKLITKGLESYTPSNQRSQLVKTKKNTVILDCYNANPSSVREALHNLGQRGEHNKVAILGDMFELGDFSEQRHKEIIDLARDLKIDNALFVGPQFKSASSHYDFAFENKGELIPFLQQHPLKKALILLKGSRGMKMEDLLEYL